MSIEYSNDEYEEYVNGLVELKVVNQLGEDRYTINKDFYKKGMKFYLKLKHEDPDINHFKAFNMGMLYQLVEQIGVMTSEDEMEKYISVLMSCFAASGLYDNLFGEGWQKYLEDDDDESF